MYTLAIRVDCNRHIGLGHFFRCFYFAQAEISSGMDVCFLMLESSMNDLVKGLLEREKIRLCIVSTDEDAWKQDITAIQNELEKGNYDALVVDLLEPDPHDNDLQGNTEYIAQDIGEILRIADYNQLVRMVFSDRFDPMDFAAEVVVNTCPDQKPVWYGNSDSIVLLGPDYYIPSAEVAARVLDKKQFTVGVRRVTIFCGGYDHRGFGEMIIDALPMANIDLKVILGGATPDAGPMISSLEARGIDVYYKIPDLSGILADSDFVFSTAGNTLFDLSAMGIPTAVVSTRGRQHITARFFSSQGGCIDLGSEAYEIQTGVKRILKHIMPDDQLLLDMSFSGKKLVDGQGAKRVSAQLLECLTKKLNKKG